MPLFLRATALLAMLSTSAVAENDAHFRIEGAAPGVGPQAYSAALDNAAVALIIDEITVAAGTDDLAPFSPILQHASAYIRSYSVVQQREVRDETYVEIEGVLDRELLQADLAKLILHSHEREPRVLILLTMKGPTEEDPVTLAYHGELYDALAESFEHKPVEIMDPLSVRQFFDTEALLAILQGDQEQLSGLVERTLADVLVVVHVVTSQQPGGPNSNLTENWARLQLTMYAAGSETPTRELEFESVVRSLEGNEGLHQAELDVCKRAQKPLFTATALAAVNLNQMDAVVVEILGLGQEQRLDQIQAVLAEVWGVEGVEKLAASEEAGRLKVQYTGPMARLTDSLLSHHFDGFELRPSRIVGQRMVLTVH